MKTPISFARCTYYPNDSSDSITVDYDFIDIPNNTITLNNIERQEQILKEFRKLISDATESFGIEDILINVKCNIEMHQNAI